MINRKYLIVRELTATLTLECIRMQFSNCEDEVYIDDSMSFISPNGLMIERSRESTITLKEVLIDMKTLIIEKSRMHLDEKAIVEIYNLEYGVKMSNNILVRSKMKAIMFTGSINIEEDQYDQKHTKVCKNSYDNLCVRNSIADENISTVLPWSPLSLSLPASSHTDSSTTYDINMSVKLMVEVTEKRVVLPTNEFKNAVMEALKHEDAFLELKRITEMYGEYIILKAKIGGKILRIKVDESLNFTHSKQRISGEVFNHSNKNYFWKTESILGGNKHEYENDFNRWKNSLKDYKKWVVISYDRIELIFNILDEGLRQEIIKIIVGQKILFSAQDQIEVFLRSGPIPYEHELHIPPDLQSDIKSYQIIASAINKKTKEEFFMKVFYTSDSSASLLLYMINERDEEIIMKCTGKIKNKVQRYNIEICWMIIGYPKDFINARDNFNLNIKISSNSVSGDVIEIYDDFQKHRLHPLETCSYDTITEFDSIQLKSRGLTKISGISSNKIVKIKSSTGKV
ncbi:10563_t:CDS:2 [Acaulospora morrowiae]|uniref:10563_t:CDS:1 n=1 Tax=Acaulospora morrowiae TaxID=94023 RepID=A0A9N8W9A1_9GLOM|nr:10563_t:CDS:2 [Acaulospora morrowiae]